MLRWRRLAAWVGLLLVAGIAFFLALPSAAGAVTYSSGWQWRDSSTDLLSGTTGTPSSTSPLSFVGPPTETINLASVKGQPSVYRGSIDLLIQNNGNAAATIKLSLVSDPTVAGSTVQVHGKNEPFVVPAEKVTGHVLTIETSNTQAKTLSVVLTVTSPADIPPTTEVFTLVRKLSLKHAIVPCVIGFGFGLVFFATRFGWWPRGCQRTGRVYPPPTWTFGGSWVTGIAGLSAVLATVLASTGTLTDALPGFDVQQFVVLNIILGGFLLAGPMFYNALSEVVSDGAQAQLSHPAPVAASPPLAPVAPAQVPLKTAVAAAEAAAVASDAARLAASAASAAYAAASASAKAAADAAIAAGGVATPPAATRPDPPGVYGRALGLIVASSCTLVGVAGQLTTLAALVLLSNAGTGEKGCMLVAVVIFGVLLFWYAWQSVGQLAKSPPSTGGGAPFLTGI
jgi:hypothetical protein